MCLLLRTIRLLHRPRRGDRPPSGRLRQRGSHEDQSSNQPRWVSPEPPPPVWVWGVWTSIRNASPPLLPSCPTADRSELQVRLISARTQEQVTWPPARQSYNPPPRDVHTPAEAHRSSEPAWPSHRPNAQKRQSPHQWVWPPWWANLLTSDLTPAFSTHSHHLAVRGGGSRRRGDGHSLFLWVSFTGNGFLRDFDLIAEDI